MIDEILNVIREKLPESTAGALKDYISKCQIIEAQLKAASSENKIKCKEIELLKNENEILKKLKLSEENLNNKENHLNKKELYLDKTILEIKLKASEDSLNKIYGLTEIIFRNPKLTYTKHGHKGNDYISENITMEEIK